jgi:alpha-mannosidase
VGVVRAVHFNNRSADWLDAPPVVYAHLPIGSSSASPKLELLSLSPPTVRLTACKPSHDGNALIVRIQEATGQTTRASLRLAKPPVNIDRPLRSLEIVTFRIERDGSCREVDMIDET